MSTDKAPTTDQQAKRRPRRKRTQADRQKRDAWFSQKPRGRPKGTIKTFATDPDRFAIVLVYFGEVVLKLSRHSAAYAAVALTSKRKIDARLVEGVLLHLNGGPDNARLRSAAQRLIDKCNRSATTTDDDRWILSSIRLLRTFIKLATDPSPDPAVLAAVSHMLIALGWSATLKAITGKIAAIAGSNLMPSDEAVSRRMKAFAETFRTKPKS